MASAAEASWRLTKEDHHAEYRFNHDSGMYARSWAQALASGIFVQGEGYAVEPVSAPVDTTSTAAAVGTLYRSYYHTPSPPDELVGEVEFSGESEIEGSANLIDDHCTGVAVGFCELKIIADKVEWKAYAEVTKSAASTKAGTSGSFSMSINTPLWGGFGFDIADGAGEGEYFDSDRDIIPFEVKCPVKSFIIRTKNRAYIHVWCNEFWGISAEVEAYLEGKLSCEYWLLSWPVCP